MSRNFLGFVAGAVLVFLAFLALTSDSQDRLLYGAGFDTGLSDAVDTIERTFGRLKPRMQHGPLFGSDDGAVVVVTIDGVKTVRVVR